MIDRQDAQWWAGAVGGAILAGSGAAFGHHPWDMIIGGVGAALVAFSMYKVTPAGSVKQ